MVHVAKEMERQGFELPLLIGGATTSKVHTAVKIEPSYSHPIVYVPDASRAVGVASNLLSTELKPAFVQRVREEYQEIRRQRADQASVRKYTSLERARANKKYANWSAYTPPKPSFLGTQIFDDYPLQELLDRIDWMPFFMAWELTGKFPRILDDSVVGNEARKLFNDAQAMLRKIIDDKWLTARAVIGFFPANTVNDDDIELYTDESRTKVLTTLHHIRQQMARQSDQPNFCLADFIAPKGMGVPDYLGAFAVTAGIGIEEHIERFSKELDDYSSILLKALADRLAEALAERMHERVRKELWGYAPEEEMANEDLIKEEYRGIRPAPGYPACPDHTEKATLWELIRPDTTIGLNITESFAMYPAAAVSGWYFSHPESRYFGTGKIQRDQVEDYARRKGMEVRIVERWLAPILAYEN